MSALDFTHDASASSWVESARHHPAFPLQNLPLGIFTPPGASVARGGVAIGEEILDVAAVAGLLAPEARAGASLAGNSTLNDLLGQGNEALRALRHGLVRLLSDPSVAAKVRPALHRSARCTMHLPVRIGNYTDFFAGIHHARRMGLLSRPDNPLLPNYKYVPIGYHGRASSVRPSGAPLIRPSGQVKGPSFDQPAFGPCRRLDYELEMAVWVGRGNELGHPVPIAEAADHIAGLSILNDWSARDIQAWEYQPLGPFIAKNFLTTVSPWIVTLDALAPFRVPQPARAADDPAPLPYLSDAKDQGQGAFLVFMEVWLQTARMREQGLPPHRLSRGPMTSMYWTVAQLVAHHASGGCNLEPGDLLGTGTLSGEEAGSVGSLLELSDAGKKPIELPGGEWRTFLEDGDEITMRADAQRTGYATIGFGSCSGRVEARRQ